MILRGSQLACLLCAGTFALAGCSRVEQESTSETRVIATAKAADGSSVRVSSGSSLRDDGARSASVSDSRSNGARAVSIANDSIDFKYAYPAKAGWIDDLASLLDTRLERAKADLEESAREGRAAARSGDYPYHNFSYAQKWQVVADLPRFLSLNADIATYEGGAHGNAFHDAMIWDRKGGIARDPLAMFTSADAFWGAAQERYCDGLNAERKERGLSVDEAGPFGKCPRLDELTLLIGSAGGKQFDRVELLAAPYVAGAYAEGTYAVTLPVDTAMLAVVKPEYRPYFAKL